MIIATVLLGAGFVLLLLVLLLSVRRVKALRVALKAASDERVAAETKYEELALKVGNFEATASRAEKLLAAAESRLTAKDLLIKERDADIQFLKDDRDKEQRITAAHVMRICELVPRVEEAEFALAHFDDIIREKITANALVYANAESISSDLKGSKQANEEMGQELERVRNDLAGERKAAVKMNEQAARDIATIAELDTEIGQLKRSLEEVSADCVTLRLEVGKLNAQKLGLEVKLAAESKISASRQPGKKVAKSKGKTKR